MLSTSTSINAVPKFRGNRRIGRRTRRRANNRIDGQRRSGAGADRASEDTVQVGREVVQTRRVLRAAHLPARSDETSCVNCSTSVMPSSTIPLLPKKPPSELTNSGAAGNSVRAEVEIELKRVVPTARRGDRRQHETVVKLFLEVHLQTVGVAFVYRREILVDLTGLIAVAGPRQKQRISAHQMAGRSARRRSSCRCAPSSHRSP